MKRAKREKAANEAASQGSDGANKEEMGSSGSRPASAAAAGAEAEAVAFVAAEDADALECGVCFHPLKPPIFQVNPIPYTHPAFNLFMEPQVLQLQPLHIALL